MKITVQDSTGAFLVGEGSKRKKRKGKHKHHAEFERLIDSLMNGPLTSDEAPGHPFHGNQYVEVAGQQVNVPTKGSVKEKLHHLFAQGHKFTLKELAALLGQSEVTLRGRLSEIKKAAPAGGMFLEKNGEHYTLKKKEAGESIEPPANTAEQFKKEQEAIKLSEALAAPTPSPEPVAPPPEPAKAPEEPPQTLAEKTLPDVGEFDPPATGKMPKEEADKIYKASQEKWVNTVINAGFPAVDTIEPETIKALAQGFKNNKNNGMAQWAANVKGTAQKAIEPQVFKADEQFVKDVLGGMTYANAMAAWKSNTAAEKAGTWPPDPFKEALAKEAAIVAKAKSEFELKTTNTALHDSVQFHAPHFDVVADYAVAHVQIGMEDFVGTSKFQSEITSLKSKLAKGHTDSVGNKIGVQKALEDRLADSKAFQALKTQRGAQNAYNGSLEAVLISAWAGSSGDHQPVSVANQLAIRDAFAMNPNDVATDALHLITKTKASDDEVYKQAADKLDCRYGTESERLTFKAGLRDFALAQYHNTQDHFKAMGIEEVYVARGSAGNVGVEKKQGEATHGTLKLQPASSFSANYGTAAGSFSKGDSIYLTKVPASQVLSTYATGFGCTNEHEVVVLAHPKTAAVRIGSHFGGSLSSAIDHIKSTMKNAPAPTEAMLAKMEADKAKWTVAQHKKALLDTKVGSAPHVPKVPKGVTKLWAKPVYEAAKKGDVEATKHAISLFNEAKAKTNQKYPYTTAYMEKMTAHAELVAAHKEAVAKAKIEVKAELKKQPKPKKTQVHIHVHEGPTEAQVAKGIAEIKAEYAAKNPTTATIAQAMQPTPEWYAKHPMHNEAKYKQMVLAGKTPIQIKHYYGSLKHAAQKKQGATA